MISRLFHSAGGKEPRAPFHPEPSSQPEERFSDAYEAIFAELSLPEVSLGQLVSRFEEFHEQSQKSESAVPSKVSELLNRRIVALLDFREVSIAALTIGELNLAFKAMFLLHKNKIYLQTVRGSFLKLLELIEKEPVPRKFNVYFVCLLASLLSKQETLALHFVKYLDLTAIVSNAEVLLLFKAVNAARSSDQQLLVLLGEALKDFPVDRLSSSFEMKAIGNYATVLIESWKKQMEPAALIEKVPFLKAFFVRYRQWLLESLDNVTVQKHLLELCALSTPSTLAVYLGSDIVPGRIQEILDSFRQSEVTLQNFYILFKILPLCNNKDWPDLNLNSPDELFHLLLEFLVNNQGIKRFLSQDVKSLVKALCLWNKISSKNTLATASPKFLSRQQRDSESTGSDNRRNAEKERNEAAAPEKKLTKAEALQKQITLNILLQMIQAINLNISSDNFSFHEAFDLMALILELEEDTDEFLEVFKVTNRMQFLFAKCLVRGAVKNDSVSKLKTLLSYYNRTRSGSRSLKELMSAYLDNAPKAKIQELYEEFQNIKKAKLKVDRFHEHKFRSPPSKPQNQSDEQERD